ncbi:hypothetical protein LCGC14_0469510 [marine sediment metagenome]|uniref:Phenylalanyl-tRNA synthetase domain-containing protein n=1 Tax=marine sediment metagenome TaxID=412755 RepID=A0A0F9UZA8_9ZZZZ
MVLEYPNKISWRLLSEGITFYQKQDFIYKEVPWLAPTEIPEDYRYKTPLGDPVASGEQSFLYLDINGELPKGRYMTVTPCFRDEEEDEFHKRQFMKLELYITDNVSESNLDNVICTCQAFFNKFIWKWPIKKVDMGDGTFDITSHDIELGSYGIREHKNLKWIYATGVAEPRLSQVRILSIRDK